MNLSEAVRNDKPFRLPSFVDGWFWWVSSGMLVAGEYPQIAMSVDLQSEQPGDDTAVGYLTRTDYEPRQMQASITTKDFWKAVLHTSLTDVNGLHDLAVELGLEDPT